ncbi:uteroglobin [Phacochoerus africanus]|uniref:uteroglobin n=1 Tax=Phacochoerus africanus TaxID=41426 RepID=UPI001FD9EE92|nr:uteroglobin [Phacochoerus africanus]
MKLAVTFTLVALIFFCSPASAEVCPIFLEVIQNLFKGTLASYQASIEPFSPNEDMKEAGTQLKMLVDTLSPEAKDSVLKLKEKIVKSPLCA